MQLGTLISHLQNEGDAAATLEALGDLALFAQIRETGARYDEAPGAYAAGAAARFAVAASDGDWTTLLGTMERAVDPGQAALTAMIRWALLRDAQECEGASLDVCSCSAHRSAEGLP